MPQTRVCDKQEDKAQNNAIHYMPMVMKMANRKFWCMGVGPEVVLLEVGGRFEIVCMVCVSTPKYPEHFGRCVLKAGDLPSFVIGSYWP